MSKTGLMVSNIKTSNKPSGKESFTAEAPLLHSISRELVRGELSTAFTRSSDTQGVARISNDVALLTTDDFVGLGWIHTNGFQFYAYDGNVTAVESTPGGYNISFNSLAGKALPANDTEVVLFKRTTDELTVDSLPATWKGFNFKATANCLLVFKFTEAEIVVNTIPVVIGPINPFHWLEGQNRGYLDAATYFYGDGEAGDETTLHTLEVYNLDSRKINLFEGNILHG